MCMFPLCQSFLNFQEIFSSYSHKTDHFQRINRRTNIPYTEMLFFDDEDRNINSVRSLFFWLFFVLYSRDEFLENFNLAIFLLHYFILFLSRLGLKNGCYKHLGWQWREHGRLERRAVQVCTKPVAYGEKQARLTKSLKKLELVKNRGAIKFTIDMGNMKIIVQI